MRLLIVLATIVTLVGCRPAQPPAASLEPPHEADEEITEADVAMPADYADAVVKIKAYCAAIRDQIGAGNPSNAHRPLDELNIVLNKLPSIAKDSGVPKESWETINVTARKMRNLFDQIHSAIDENRQPDYQALAERIDLAIAQLEQVAQ